MDIIKLYLKKKRKGIEKQKIPLQMKKNKIITPPPQKKK